MTMMNFKILKNGLIGASLGLVLSIAPVQADTSLADYDRASKEEATGFFSGLALGALAGGPPGAIIGAVAGALTGDGIHARNEANELEADLYHTQLELALLKDEVTAREEELMIARRDLERLQDRLNEPQLLPALSSHNLNSCCDNTVLSLHFRTGSSEIETHYLEQLDSLVKLAKNMPAAQVEITGYADRNGDAQNNLELSRQRSNSVKTYLARLGIDNSSIRTIGYGESRPLASTQTFENDFFDRRVMVRIRDGSKQLLTVNPGN